MWPSTSGLTLKEALQWNKSEVIRKNMVLMVSTFYQLFCIKDYVV